MTHEKQSCDDIVAGDQPKEKILIKGCTAHFDRSTKKLSISVFGKEIISENIAGPDEKDYWIGYDDGDRIVDFNIYTDEQTKRYKLAVYPVIDGRTDGTTWQNIPLAFDLIGEIKNLLRVLGTKELNLENVEQPSMALWWDNKEQTNETMVLTVGMDDMGDLYLTLDDGCGGDVQIWESCDQLSDNDLEPVLENIREHMAKPSKMSFQELARSIYDLPAGKTFHFKRHADRDLYGVIRLDMFECDTLLISYYGGGNTSVFDATQDYSAADIASWLRDVIEATDDTTVYQIKEEDL